MKNNSLLKREILTRGKTKFTKNMVFAVKMLNPKVIFEFGAFNGADTLFYRGTFPDAEIYSFEPDPVLYEEAKPLLEEERIRFYNYAISDAPGTVDFHYWRGLEDKDYHGPAGSFFDYTDQARKDHSCRWEFVSEPLKVKCITLKDFCQENEINHINFIHMDVEGAIHLVLRGMGDLRPELIYAEIESDKVFKGALAPRQYTELFLEMGYVPIDRNGADVLFKLKGS